MARTIQQAMAYLGLKENDHERSSQSARRVEQDYRQEDVYEDEIFYTYDESSEVAESRASFASTAERDVLLGILDEPTRPAAPAQQEMETEQSRIVTLPGRSERAGAQIDAQWGDEGATSGYSDQAEVTYRPAAPKTTRFTSDESDTELRRITTIHPRSYNDAKIIGESFRENIPVIMNVTDMGDTEAKRLVDFSAGLAFALHGSIERVTDKVFLLTPANLEVLGAEGSEVPVALDSDDAGLFNQG